MRVKVVPEGAFLLTFLSEARVTKPNFVFSGVQEGIGIAHRPACLCFAAVLANATFTFIEKRMFVARVCWVKPDTTVQTVDQIFFIRLRRIGAAALWTRIRREPGDLSRRIKAIRLGLDE